MERLGKVAYCEGFMKIIDSKSLGILLDQNENNRIAMFN